MSQDVSQETVPAAPFLQCFSASASEPRPPRKSVAHVAGKAPACVLAEDGHGWLVILEMISYMILWWWNRTVPNWFLMIFDYFLYVLIQRISCKHLDLLDHQEREHRLARRRLSVAEAERREAYHWLILLGVDSDQMGEEWWFLGWAVRQAEMPASACRMRLTSLKRLKRPNPGAKQHWFQKDIGWYWYVELCWDDTILYLHS